MARFRPLCALMWFIAAASAGQGIAASQTPPEQSQPAPRPSLTPRSHEQRESRYRDLHHIILNVLAVDDSNNPATGLTAQDFLLTDNGQPQNLASFREVDGTRAITPPRVILILDTVDNTARSIALEIREIDKYLGTKPGRLLNPTAIAILTPSGLRTSQPSTDPSVLLQESRTLFKDIHPYQCKSPSEDSPNAYSVSSLGGQNIGYRLEKLNDGDCLSERFKLSLTALDNLAAAQLNVPVRVVLVWIGPGWPLLAGPEFHPDTPDIHANFFAHIVQLSRSLREGQVTVDAVYAPDIFRKTEMQSLRRKPFAEGPRTEAQATAGDLALQAIATQSGGRVLESKNIAEQIARCVADVQKYYALSFDSAPSTQIDEYHSLQVKVNKPGVKVLTSTLYYAEP